VRRLAQMRAGTEGSALLEFALVLPLLVVFIVGIYDFSGAFNQRQKISHATQEGAVFAAAQPRTDIDPTNGNPDSLQQVAAAIAASLAANQVVPEAGCGALAAAYVSGLKWQYTFTCGADTLTIIIDRGVVVDPGPPALIGSRVEVSYPYHWRFNSVIQLLFPGAGYAAITILDEAATVHNQM